MLAASLLISGLSQHVVAANTTAVCTDCTTNTEARQTNNATVTIEQLKEALELMKKEESPAKSDFDKEYEALACKEKDSLDTKSKSNKYEFAMCLAANLEKISTRAEELDGAESAKLKKLYTKAKLFIKGQLARTFDVANIDNPEALDEAREKFDDLASAIDDSSWNAQGESEDSDLSMLKAGLEEEVRNRIEMNNRRKYFKQAMLPQIQQASQDLNKASLITQETGNFQYEYYAQTRYDALMLQARKFANGLNVYDPSDRIDLLAQYAPSSSLKYFETYYNASYESIMNNLRVLGLNNIDQGLNNYSGRQFNNNIRQVRGSQFSSSLEMPEVGSIYNSGIPTNNGLLNNPNNNNNDAVTFLSNNPNVVGGSRSRN